MDPTHPKTPPPPARGDRIPDLYLPDPDGTVVSFYDNVQGDPIALAFGADPRGLLDALGECGRLQAFVVAPGRPPAVAGGGRTAERSAADLVFDPEGQAARALGFSWEALGLDRARIFLLDPNQRLLEQFDGATEAAAAACVESARGLGLFGESRRPSQLAPVLMIPRVFEPKFCRRLIDVFHQRGHEESGVFSLHEGELRHRVDHSMKKRRDHYVQDDDIRGEISRRMSRRVLPEIFKAFCYRVTRLEEFKIVCYRADEEGYFRAHRDNYSPQTVHRRFALTLNLNSGGYRGGELRFPEYGPHLYRPETGEAIVFSCSLLHEAMDVTEGERYVLLAFLYGEDGAREKEKMARRMGAAGP